MTETPGPGPEGPAEPLQPLQRDPARPVQDGWAELVGPETEPSASERAVHAMNGMIDTVEANFVASEAEKALPYQVIELYFDDDGEMVFPGRGSDHHELHVLQYSHARYGGGEKEVIQETDIVIHTPPSRVTDGIDYEYKYRQGNNLATVQRADQSNRPVPVVSGDGASYLEWLKGNLDQAIEGINRGFGDPGAGVDDV
jgi:hypothetical protein